MKNHQTRIALLTTPMLLFITGVEAHKIPFEYNDPALNFLRDKQQNDLADAVARYCGLNAKPIGSCVEELKQQDALTEAAQCQSGYENGIVELAKTNQIVVKKNPETDSYWHTDKDIRWSKEHGNHAHGWSTEAREKAGREMAERAVARLKKEYADAQQSKGAPGPDKSENVKTERKRTYYLTVKECLAEKSKKKSDSLANSLDARRQVFETLLAEHWDFVLTQDPEYASIIGDKRFNDKSGDFSARAIHDYDRQLRAFKARLQVIDSSGFSEQEQLTKDLLIKDIDENLERYQFGEWKMPLNHFWGYHQWASMLVSLLPFQSVKDYDDYIVRMRNLPKQFEDIIENMRLGKAENLMWPQSSLEKVATQCKTVADSKPEKSIFASPLAKMPKNFPVTERQRINKAFFAAIRESVLPAYAHLAKFVREEYAPHGRPDQGIWALSDGADRYAMRLRYATTTGITPDEIHEIGLREVARIEQQMLSIAKQLGYSDLRSFAKSVEKNPALHPKSREEIVQIFQKHLETIYQKLPTLFGHLPKAPCEVKAVERFREKGMAAAEYLIPSEDGSRPGFIDVNTGDFAKRTTLTMETTTYHEGVPGHHLQLTIQQELKDLPPVRRHWFNHTAYVEGWALYSESLGKEIGLYRDPYSLYGHYQDEMLRAIRLVVDTGLHSKKWTRDQVIQFFHDHSTIDEVDIQAETDRYIVWPGQAVAYKVGELRIRELRTRAQEALGPRFDIRRFHDEVLGAGSIPLDILTARITKWIESEKQRKDQTVVSHVAGDNGK